MTLARQTAAVVVRCLDRCFAEVKPGGPWRWQCTAQNGASHRVIASMGEGFLHLACNLEPDRKEPDLFNQALLANSTLPGGVGLALGRRSGLQLRSDLAILDESQLIDRIQWALNALRDGLHVFPSRHPETSGFARQGALSPDPGFAERLLLSGWTCAERGPREFSAQLDAVGAPPAMVRAADDGVVFSVDLVRLEDAAQPAHQALAIFLLTTCGKLRLVRAYATRTDSRQIFGLEVNLPPLPASEEIDHALAALSLGYRVCAREAALLLNETAARSYLAARGLSNNHQSYGRKEN
jgi:hypothetical protein